MVKVINWNPREKLFKRSRLFRVKRLKRVNNFGDLIGPLVVQKILERNGITANKTLVFKKRLLTVGSILHFAKSGDTIWGTGRNGKIPYTLHKFKELDVRAVRGPLTHEFLVKKKIYSPEIFGDPALLLPILFDDLKIISNNKKYDLTIIPNLNDLELFEKYEENLIDPCGDFYSIVERIAQSNFVVGSSLHAIVVAESLGIPARLVQGNSEPSFKYEDYYLGTGRSSYKPAKNIMSAMEMGGETKLTFDSDKLINSFPFDIY